MTPARESSSFTHGEGLKPNAHMPVSRRVLSQCKARRREKGEGGLRGTGHSPRSRAQPHGAIQALLSGAAEGTDAMGCCSPPASLARLWLCWPSPCYPSPRRRVSSSSRVTYRQGERAGEEGTGKGACHAACMEAGHSSPPGRAGSAFLPLLMSSSKGMAHERRQKGSEKRARSKARSSRVQAEPRADRPAKRTKHQHRWSVMAGGAAGGHRKEPGSCQAAAVPTTCSCCPQPRPTGVGSAGGIQS